MEDYHLMDIFKKNQKLMIMWYHKIYLIDISTIIEHKVIE